MLSHSVVSGPLRSCGLQPTRLVCPWDSPGKKSGLPCPPPGDLADLGVELPSLMSLALAGRSLPLAPPSSGDRVNSPFLHTFVLIRLSMDWRMPTHTVDDHFYCLLLQMLISSRDTLTDTARNHVLPAIWASLSLVKLTHRTNHQDFPGSPVVKTLCFQGRGCEFNSWSEN